MKTTGGGDGGEVKMLQPEKMSAPRASSRRSRLLAPGPSSRSASVLRALCYGVPHGYFEISVRKINQLTCSTSTTHCPVEKIYTYLRNCT